MKERNPFAKDSSQNNGGNTPLKNRFGLLKNTGDEIAGATGFVLSRSSVFIHFGGPQGHGDSLPVAEYPF